MANKTRDELKQYFQTGNKPTQQEYADLIDNSVHKDEDKASLADIEIGTNSTKFVTPAGAKRAVEEHINIATISTPGIVRRASVPDAEQGIDINAYVTPEGVKKAIQYFAPDLSPIQSVNGMTGDVTLNTIEDSGWHSANLQNGIVNYGGTYQQARFRKINKTVYIEGLIRQGPSSGNVDVFILPLEYRPSKRIILQTVRSNGVFRTDILATGEVRCYSYDSQYTSISGISFLVD